MADQYKVVSIERRHFHYSTIEADQNRFISFGRSRNQAVTNK